MTNLSGQVGVGVVVERSASLHPSAATFLSPSTGDKPVVLDKVEPDDMQSGFDFVGAYVVPHPEPHR